MVTASNDPNNILMAVNNGATSYIVKPVSHDDLTTTIAQAMEWRERNSEPQ
jgi:DNA-binding NtrC family response regulator